MFYVSQDLENASGPRVHAETCGNYTGRKLDATTMRWHGPYSTRDEAIAFANGIARAPHAAGFHSCVRPS